MNRYFVGQVWFQDDTWYAHVAHVIAGLAPQDGQTLADGGNLGCGALYHQIACQQGQCAGDQVLSKLQDRLQECMTMAKASH